MIQILCKRADAFFSNNLDPFKKRKEVSEDLIEKQKLFLENMLVQRKVDELKSSSSGAGLNMLAFEELRQKAKMTQKNKPILGKRSFSDLTVTMSIAQLKEHLNIRSTEARTRLQKMRKISDSLDSTVKESRGCSIE